MKHERSRLLILGVKQQETGDFAGLAASPAWTQLDSASLDRPAELLRKALAAAREPASLIVHALGPIPAYLAAGLFPKTVPIIASGVGESEFFWNRWLCQRVSVFWETAPIASMSGPEDALEFPIWGFGDWTARSGVREILWSFTMIRVAGWKCRLHLFGQGPWKETLRTFADLASTGPQIEFHSCLPGAMTGLRLPALVFSPRPENIPAWLARELGETEILTSAKSPLPGNETSPLRFVPIPWKPSAMAITAMKILGHCRESGRTFSKRVSESIGLNTEQCYREIRRQLSRASA